MLDYTKATKWLRDLLHYSDGYTSRSTNLPSHNSHERTSSTDNNNSMVKLGSDNRHRSSTGKSHHPSLPDSKVDRFKFKRAVSDLERLLNEAVTLAAGATDVSETRHPQPFKEPSISLHSHCHSSSPVGTSTSSGATVLPSVRDDAEIPNRLPMEHASTSPGRVGRPRSDEKVKDYSYKRENLPRKSSSPVDISVTRRIAFKIPHRESSRIMTNKVIPHESALPTLRLIEAKKLPIDVSEIKKVIKDSEDIVDFQDYFSHHGDLTSSAQRASPSNQPTARVYEGHQMDIDDPPQPMHGEHGVSLRHRSHISLPETRGFIAMPLLFPQAISVSSQRLENTGSWRAMLIASRALMGASLGFASMNFHSTLTDLFGASLMSTNPHQEVADVCDARRHGGGMGVWLGLWTWCWIGSLGVGFLIGAILIDHYPPVWGFYVSVMMVATVLFLNVICPEVRRSAYRRSIAEVRSGEEVSRRIARGEIMMHRIKTGPKWWGEEVYHGILLCGEMLRQPGFFLVAVYSGWIYAQVVLLILLLGSLASNLYRFYATGVGLLVACLSLGALLAVPFQKANLFSRSRQAQLDTNRATLENKVAWTSHLVRRLIFTTILPISGVCYACLSYGPPLSIAAPTIFATLVGFLSCLAISECNGLMMETFDTSDLSPGMTGRSKGSENRHTRRTNYSSFPRVTAGFAVIHTFAFVLAAGATALAGGVTRRLGQQVASGVVAGILFLLTIALSLGLARFKEVQIVPNSKAQDMDRLSEVRRESTMRRASMPDDPQAAMEEENAWRPVMIGNPISKMRRMNIFELGALTRWQEIRKKNKLIDEGAHLNRAALGDGLDALDDQFADLRSGAQGLLRIGSTKSRGSRRLHRSDHASDPSHQSLEMDDLSCRSGENGITILGQIAEQGLVNDQVVTGDKEEDKRAVRRRSIAKGKNPADGT
ncbi:hypothetical protein NLU13_5574 [Sarocladium strictum]|uniref:Polyamine transport protein n=1 Tax=Sarocladium strictum TaxID=5046 RepID=A0AA39GHG8_SARSR|nr:hypothetical protein NLU13_5574 [Sarocladium strictum]